MFFIMKENERLDGYGDEDEIEDDDDILGNFLFYVLFALECPCLCCCCCTGRLWVVCGPLSNDATLRA